MVWEEPSSRTHICGHLSGTVHFVLRSLYLSSIRMSVGLLRPTLRPTFRFLNPPYMDVLVGGWQARKQTLDLVSVGSMI